MSKVNCTVRQASSNVDAKHYDTERIRKEYLVQNIMVPGEINMVYSMFDRIITGGAVPVKHELKVSYAREGTWAFSSCGLQDQKHRLNGYGSWGQLFCSMWDLPRSGIKPMSPASVGRFLPTASPGKSNPAHSSGFFFFYQLLGAGVLNWAMGCRGSRIETVEPRGRRTD